MEVNKVVYGGEPLIDLTSDSVTEDTLLEGETAHDKSGAKITGKAVVGNGKLTVKNNGTTVGEFTANQTADTIIDVGTNEYEKVISRGEQLVVNGNGLMGNNTNFKTLSFDGAVTNNSAGSFTYPSGKSATILTDEFFPVNPRNKYRLCIDAKTANGTSRAYSFLSFFDVDKNQIDVKTHIHNSASTTTLARELKAGDTVVYLTDASGWSTSYSYGFYLTIWNYTNSYGYTYPAGTYSRNRLTLPSVNNKLDPSALNTSAKTVTLKSAYTGATVPAGTYVSQGGDGGTYKYIALSSTIVPTTWQTYTGYIGGVDTSGGNVAGKFPPAVAYCKVGFLWNQNKATDQMWVTNVTVDDVSDVDEAKSYTDQKVAGLSKPSNAKMSIRRNNVEVGYFTADQASDSYVNIKATEVFTAVFNDTTYTEVVEASTKGYVVQAYYEGLYFPLIGIDNSAAVFLVSTPEAAMALYCPSEGSWFAETMPYVGYDEFEAHKDNDERHFTADEKTVLSKIEFERNDGGDHATINADDLHLGNKRVLTDADAGVANGVASLDSSGKVPSSQLPSYVDDVLEYSAKSSFPATGESGKIYIDKATNKTYRWSGSAYAEISASLALGETSSTAYAGDKGKEAHDLASAANAALTNKVDKVNGKGLSTEDYTTAEKNKLAGIAAGAQKNTITGVKGNSESSYRTGNVNITASNIGLGNVANERQYSANNPPPYPVTSVAGRTGAVTLKYSDLSGVPVSVVEEGGSDVAVIGAPYAKLSDGKKLVTPDDVTYQIEDEAALKSEGTVFVKGTGSTVGTWLGSSDRITSYYDGLTIRYKIPVAGSSTTTLKINELGAKTVYRFSTTKLTTQFPVGSIIHLTYHESLNSGCWMCNDYDANTQMRVYRQNSGYTTADYPLLVSRTKAADIATPGTNGSNEAVYGVMWDDTSKVPTLNPSTGELKAVKFTGAFNGNATSATSATKATQDASGNVITSTYAKKSELPTTTQMDNWDSSADNASAALTKASAALPKAGGTMDSTAVIKWPTKNNLNPFIGYCTASSDGTFIIASLEGTKWDTGLAIGGSSKNLLWKGKQVAVKTDIPSVPSVGNGTLTIKRNGTSVGTFSANQSSAASVNISVPIDLDQTGDNDVAVLNAYEARMSDGTRLVRGDEFDDYVESQSPRAVIENKGFVLVEKASAPTGFTISDGTTSTGALSLRILEDEHDSSKMKAWQCCDVDIVGNNLTLTHTGTPTQSPEVALALQTVKKSGKYCLRFNFSHTGTITNTTRPNEVLSYVNGTLKSVDKLTNGSTCVATILNVNAGDTIEMNFWGNPSGDGIFSNYTATFKNICLTCEENPQSVTNNSNIPTKYARTVIASDTLTKTLRASYYESLNATLEKFRQAIIALGGTV